MFVFDAHLDLSMNALEWNRDLTRPIAEIREREQGMNDKPDRGLGTVCLPEMRKGQVGCCIATLIARYVKRGNTLPGWNSRAIAWAQTQGQLAWYRAMENAGEIVQIRDCETLDRHVDRWNDSAVEQLPVGYILSLEGADSILSPAHLEQAYEQGLRAVGLSHYGPGIYAQGTHAEGGLGPKGRELLREMASLGVVLDATHLCDESFREALDAFDGHLWASHSNCRSLVPHDRQFTDEQIQELVRRRAVIGVVLDAWMLVPGWERGKSTPESMGVTLSKAIDQIDYICQLVGNAQHVGIGSDLDGAFGREQSPADLDTIADLSRIAEMLRQRGYPEEDIKQVMHGNWLRKLREVWS